GFDRAAMARARALRSTGRSSVIALLFGSRGISMRRGLVRQPSWWSLIRLLELQILINGYEQACSVSMALVSSIDGFNACDGTPNCFRLFVGRTLIFRCLDGGHDRNSEEVFMTKLATLTGLALILTVSCATAQQNTMSAGRPSAVLTPDQCNAIWSKAVP